MNFYQKVFSFLCLVLLPFALLSCDSSSPSQEPSPSETGDVKYDYLAPQKTLENLTRSLPDFGSQGKLTAFTRGAAGGNTSFFKSIPNASGADIAAFMKALPDAGYIEDASIQFNESRSIRKYHKEDSILTVYTNATANICDITVSAYGFFDWDDKDVFENVPMPKAASDPRECGGGEYIVTGLCNSVETYRSYVASIEEAGFSKFSDNIQKDEMLYASVLTKGRQTIVVTYAKKARKLYLQGALDDKPSSFLNYNANWEAEKIEGAKTTFHALPMSQSSGNSFFIQLKNGHFIAFDGGVAGNTAAFLRALKEASNGEKPIIDAWFITHYHSDHSTVFETILTSAGTNEDLAAQISVNGVYIQEASFLELGLEGSADRQGHVAECSSRALKTADGKPCDVFRIHTGESYYFADVQLDIVETFNLIEPINYSMDNNVISPGYMIYIEGQSLLNCGDMEATGQKFLAEWHNKDFLSVDFLCSIHHGVNHANDYKDLFNPKFLIHTAPSDQWLVNLAAKHGNTTWVPAFNKIKSRAQKYWDYSQGELIIEFPYQF